MMHSYKVFHIFFKISMHKEVVCLIKGGKLAATSIDKFKCEYPIPPDQIYKGMFNSYEQYPDIFQVFKLLLLILPCMANVEQGFSILNLVHTKRNKLTVEDAQSIVASCSCWSGEV